MTGHACSATAATGFDRGLGRPWQLKAVMAVRAAVLLDIAVALKLRRRRKHRQQRPVEQLALCGWANIDGVVSMSRPDRSIASTSAPASR